MKGLDKCALKGLSFAVLATLLSTPVAVSARYARQSVSATTFSVLWVAFPCVFCCIFITARLSWPVALAGIRSHLRPLIIMGTLQAVAALGFFWGMKFLDPTVAVFLGRSATVFSVIIGAAILKERFQKLEILGIVVAVIGTLIICYAPGSGPLAGMLAIIFSSLFFAVFTSIAKVNVRTLHPFIIMAASTAVASFLLTVFGIASGELTFEGTPAAYGVLAASAFAGEFLGIGAFYASMKYIGFAVTSVIRSSIPFTVALFSYLTLGLLPSRRDWLGGMILLSGILLITIINARSSPCDA